jgi:hypothetical protein
MDALKAMVILHLEDEYETYISRRAILVNTLMKNCDYTMDEAQSLVTEAMYDLHMSMKDSGQYPMLSQFM